MRAAREQLYLAGESAKKDFSTNTMMFGAFQFGDKAQSVQIDVTQAASIGEAIKQAESAVKAEDKK